MAISVFDIFKIGIGPSSSHTVGPMRAANRFLLRLQCEGVFDEVSRVQVDLYGSLGATGKGHGSDKAVLLGLEGDDPETVETDTIPQRMSTIIADKKLTLGRQRELNFNFDQDIVFYRRKSLPGHPNGMIFNAFNAAGECLQKNTYYSVGGGFVVNPDIEAEEGVSPIIEDETKQPFPFKSAVELLAHCSEHGYSISELMLQNEKVWASEVEIREKLLRIWSVMQACVDKGCKTQGILPGGLKVKRRAAQLCVKLGHENEASQIPLGEMDWVNLFALAVNEENAAGGRVVTAPTNGAAGIIPAVMHYYWRFFKGANEEGIIRFLLTAGAIAILYKENASISGAEVGCQGEVGSACSMAAGALCEVLGGTPEQVENAAEIGVEHNLGLTCDPIGGLVQVPCIERNAMGAVKAINATSLALRGDGKHFVSLDKVIKTMRDTGADMKTKYKETARGGLAVNVIEC
uniref:L-serine dehydratase n=1 Tax=uncultured Thiotrichaceae bacterium TaxID=298394 RepID=A0A6S6UJV8_9GAMM|nr:MAG: L-serine dehydratase (EC [uncultured Thiotrichaceae bacterium]